MPLTCIQLRLKVDQLRGENVVLFGSVPVLENAGSVNRHHHIKRQIELDLTDGLRMQLVHNVQRITGALAVVHVDLGRIVIGPGDPNKLTLFSVCCSTHIVLTPQV